MPALSTRRLAQALLLAAAWLAAPGAEAQPPAAVPSMGEHGMVLFGGHDGLFLSHMPMWHRPHDTQVVLQVHLADARRDAALRRELAARPVLWTIVPERFELDRLAPDAADPIRAFHADVVRGHFERGGKTQSTGDEFVIERVLFDHRLAPSPASAPALHYRVVDAGGATREHFLVHWIAARPDADHILRAVTPTPTTLPAQVTLPRGAALSATPRALQLALRQAGAPAARVDRAIYLETGDLE
jgi:hypothetical protein